jgi:transposase-like protein
MEMQRRKFSREFKLEAVKLVRERGVSVSQAARDLDLHENVLRRWVREQAADPGSAFPGHGVMKPEGAVSLTRTALHTMDVGL